ncbi:MAG: acetyl-CoA carboxylase biotin carboxylase subunit [bacterium]
MFHKILIANRGEIALRIIRACKELSIKTVAVYSEADANTLPVRIADEAICIGPKEATKSYLNIPAIISAAEISDAEAIHPGYGFLAENARFAEICEDCHIKFIGPSPEIIHNMGNKVMARQLMKNAGVPLVPGIEHRVIDENEALDIAQQIGFPVIIKAAGGGGGKGMRIVHDGDNFKNSYLSAQAEAMSSFDNPNVYIEKYIENPKHIEFQILGDKYGSIIHLGERDCSIQRRYQKLIEEAPCETLDPTLRAKMGETALHAASQVNYYSAGTIEFLVDKNNNFYFLEMNTRIQVEHPITEMVTGIDLVKEQILIANDEKLRYKQEEITVKGHAIECRINAENPNTFFPCPGKISSLHIPNGPGMRVDTGIYSNSTITPYYDSLIAKFIAYGANREEAILKMKTMLEEFICEGIDTTIPFHLSVLNHHLFWEGKIDTNFLTNIRE